MARALAEWRERRALESDRPRGWILADESLYAMATRAPGSLPALEAIPALAPSVVRKRGDELLQLIAAAQVDDGIEPMAPPRRPTNEEQALAGALMQVVRDAATALGIGPEILATRRDVESLAFGAATPQTSPLLRGWRGEVSARELLAPVLSAVGRGDGQQPATFTKSAYTRSTGWSALTTLSSPRAV